ncbi:MAG: FtsX-like permease family protein, partial [Bacteroidales bacterium]|nr:FtsX-like permease family protein [Bacteroidales bacterium]
CLGLFGLSSFTQSRRGFEIGVRKALGADVRTIMIYEMRKILLLLIVSSILAWIGVYFMVNFWLGSYSFKIDLNALYFFLPFALVMLISLFTVFYQAYLAANTSPGPVLKYE